MDIVKHIEYLLKTNDALVIPGLGLFSIKKNAAKVDQKRNVAIPPSIEITFKANPKVKDDSVLKNHIRIKEKLAASKATEAINAFVKASMGIIDSGEPLKLPGIGKLYKNDKGALLFEGESNLTVDAKNFGMTDVELKKASKPTATASQSSSTSSSKKEENKQETKTPAISKKESTQQTAKKEEPKVAASNTTKTEENKKVEPQKTQDVQKEQNNNSPATKKTESKKKRKGGVVLFLLWILLFVIAFFFIHNGFDLAKTKEALKLKYVHVNELFASSKPSNKKNSDKEETLDDVVEHVMEDGDEEDIAEEIEEKVADEIEHEHEVEENTPIETDFIIEYPDGRFYVIINSYRNERFANAFAKKINDLGIYYAEVVEGGGYYRVSIEKHQDPEKAQKSLDFARDEFGADAWVWNAPAE